METTPNFLTCPVAPELPAPQLALALPPPKKRRLRRWAFACVGVFLIAFFAPLAYGGTLAGIAARQARNDLSQAQSAVISQNLEEARVFLSQARTEFNRVRAGIAATGFWKYMPFVGTHLRAFEEAGRAGTTAMDGVSALLDAASSVREAFVLAGIATALEPGVTASRSFRDLSRDEKRAILSRIHDALPDVRIAREKITIAWESWERIPQTELVLPIRRAMEPATRQLRQLQRGLDEAVSIADVLLPILGYPEKKNYLVLLQNADEIRPTGGFIGTVGVISVDAADLKETKFEDVYAIDGPVAGKWRDVPPEPIKKHLGVDAWYLRDANWSPDYPLTAERILDVYARERRLAGIDIADFSGVLAFQPGFFRDLLRLTGPLRVEGKAFDAENFFDQLQYDVEIGFLREGIPVPQRKEIVAKIGDALMQRLTEQPASRWPALLDLATRSLERKDILIYDRDPAFLATLDQRGWSGRTKSSAGDFLWVIDANLAALKTDGVMDKEIRYAVDAAHPSGPVATLTLVYRNTGRRIDWRHTRYRDYVRVYVPEGSELVASSGAMLGDKTQTGGRVAAGDVETYRELGKTVFAAFWAIEPGETRELRFTYRLPADAYRPERGSYQLLVQKQPGSNTRLTLDHKFDKNVRVAAPPEEPKEFGNATYRWSGKLEQDRTVEITFGRE